MIQENYRIAATNTDVLASPSRLASIPYNGTLIMEMQGAANDGTNYAELTVQLPDGSTPIDAQCIHQGATDGAINMNDKYQVQFPVTQGGHVTVNITLYGSGAVTEIRFTLMP